MLTKTEDELKQEAEDAALARRMHEAEVQRSRQAESRPPAPRTTFRAQRDSSGLYASAACPTCTYINKISLEGLERYPATCVQCRTVLSVPHNPHDNSEAHLPSQQQPRALECPHCHMHNRLPHERGDALLCGSCFRQISRSPNAEAHTSETNDAEQNATRVIHVLCGQCNKVNALTVDAQDSTVQFTCGNCSVLNETAIHAPELL